MKNVIYFENGIVHEFTADEMNELKKALMLSQGNSAALQNLKSIFLEQLD